jgi:hypothetical protein
MSDLTDMPAGWYPDQTGRHEHRYWDGSQWTDQVSDRGQTAVDDPTAMPGPPATKANNATATAVLFSIGDIGVTRTSVVTPNGSAPLKGSQWIARDATRQEQHIPAWAIVLAILFALACLLGLLFLLVKETRTVGYVEVTVTSENLMYMTQIPVGGASAVAQVRQQVAYAQSLAAAAP